MQSRLTDDAAQLIKSLDLVEANYDVAVNMLIERYDNKRLIIQNYMHALMQQPAMVKESQAAPRKLVDDSTQHLRSLKTLGRPVDQWDDFIVYLISSYVIL